MKKLKGTQVSVAYKLLMDTLNLPVAKWIYYNLKQNVKALSPSNKAIEAKREEMFKWLKRLDTGAFDPEDETVQNTERDFTSRLEKEEYKIDPMTPILEFLGNLGSNQQVWVQYIIRAHTPEQKKSGFLWKKTDAYKDEAAKIINEIMVRDPKTRVVGKKDKETGRVKWRR